MGCVSMNVSINPIVQNKLNLSFDSIQILNTGEKNYQNTPEKREGHLNYKYEKVNFWSMSKNFMSKKRNQIAYRVISQT